MQVNPANFLISAAVERLFCSQLRTSVSGGIMSNKRSPRRLGKKLEYIRQNLGYSLEEMALAVGQAGVSKRARVYEWENGIRQPGLLQILAYAKLVGISTDTLLDDSVNLNIDKDK